MTIQHFYKQSPDGNGLLYAWFAAMHTRVDVMLYCSKSEEELMLIVSQLYDRLCQLERMANYYDPASELSAINRTASTSPVSVSEELYNMIDLCVEYHEKTLCCFDVTIHSSNYQPETVRSIHLMPRERSIFFGQQGTTINLSGFLKGYALDKIREILDAHQLPHALINMGNSSVLALGNHPHGTGWKVGFNHHTASTTGHEATSDNETILLQNEFLTTSGNDSEERRHIISPQSGKLVEGMRQVAVVTDNGATGEILSTALFVATPAQREVLKTNLRPRRIIDR